MTTTTTVREVVQQSARSGGRQLPATQQRNRSNSSRPTRNITQPEFIELD